MLASGRLRHVVYIERPVETRDALGSVTTTWQRVATTRAEVRDLSGREFFAAAAVQSEVTTTVRMRAIYGVAVQPNWRIVTGGGREFDVLSQPLDQLGNGREWTIMVKERSCG